MSTPVSAAAALLKSALDLLTSQDSACVPLSPAVCRTALYLGGEVPWDDCDCSGTGGKKGMLWAKLISIDPLSGQAQGGNCDAWNWTAEFGIVRPIAGPDQNGNPPSAAQVQSDADQQVADADAIFTVLNCCESRSELLKDVTVVRWSPVGPSGMCAGGTWTVKGRLDVCC